MSIEGWYYLHTNGDLIYKRELGDTVADLRESPFVRGIWPVDPADRLTAWNLLIEATAAGANAERIAELVVKWHADDEDAKNYAERLALRLYMDGDQWCATCNDFVNLQESAAGFGPTALAAMAALAKYLGYRPSKMWGPRFADLVKGAA